MTVSLRIENLRKKFIQRDLFKPRITSRAIDGISFTIPKQSITSIIGPNGAGKSTTIKCLLGLLKPDSGSIERPELFKTGYLPEHPYYYAHLTLRELLAFVLKAHSIEKSRRKTAIQNAAEQVRMEDHLDARIASFSKGMTQRAGIAAAIVHDPEFIILDEPMSGLDPLGRKMVFDLILNLKERGKTILFCSHILSDVERLCDKVIIMNKGKVVKELEKNDLERIGTQNGMGSLEEIFLAAINGKETVSCGL